MTRHGPTFDDSSKAFDKKDEARMQQALDLAAAYAGQTSPNPSVGAIVIDEHGRFVSEGYHERAGAPHAEAMALSRAATRARNGTLYVTLEPCNHTGRRPPCTEAIIAAGIKRVVAATTDPNPVVSGKGFERLRQAGIQVDYPLMPQRARLLNKDFMTWAATGRPYVYLKSAQSLDGKVATHTGHSQWITSPEARDDAHMLRARTDAIIVGVETVIADNPRLTARPGGQHAEKQPLKIVVDSSGRTPESSHIFSDEGGQVLMAVTEKAVTSGRIDAYERSGARVWVSQGIEGDNGRVDLGELLQHLGTMNVTSLLVEGGPTLAGSFWQHDLVDEVVFYVAPMLIGGEGAKAAVLAQGIAKLDERPGLVDFDVTSVGPDLKITGRVPRPFLLD